MRHRNHQVISSIVEDAAKKQTFSMAIQDFTPIGNNLISVVAKVSAYDKEAIAASLAEQTDSSASIVPESLRKVDNRRQQTVRFFAKPNRKMQPASSETLAKMVEINASVYADEETNAIWHLQGEGDNQVLVQQSSDDLETIFNARKQRRMMASQRDGMVAFASGDYAAYASPAGVVRSGMLYESKDGWHVFDTDSRSRVDIDPMQVLCAADITDETDELNAPELMANLSTKQGSDILGYFRKLYGSNPSFFSRLTKLVKDYDGTVQLLDTNPDVNEMLRNNVR